MKRQSKTAAPVGRGGFENHHVAVKDYPTDPSKSTGLCLSTPMDVTVLAFRPARPGKELVGWVGVFWPQARLRILDCPVFENGGSRWVMPPSKPSIDGSTVNLDTNGRPIYSLVLTFDTPATSHAFSNAVIAALLGYEPGVFDGRRP